MEDYCLRFLTFSYWIIGKSSHTPWEEETEAQSSSYVPPGTDTFQQFTEKGTEHLISLESYPFPTRQTSTR
jgi:hypothetical protein